MTWNEDCQGEIDRLIETQDVSEVMTKAVGSIVEGRIDLLLISLGHNVSCDPKQTIDFGERLLCACIDKLRGFQVPNNER